VLAQDAPRFLDKAGPYIGQKPPGKIPEYFAPGIISVDENFEHSTAIFSPDGREVYWTTNVGLYTENGIQGNLRLHYMKMVNGRWTVPQIPPFAKDLNLDRPVFSPDGTRLYFDMLKMYYYPNGAEETDIFFVERTENGWSDPVPASPLINSNRIERLHCIAADGSLYFARDPFTNNESIFVTKRINGQFTKPIELGESYNSESYEYALLISPNEEYMIICENTSSGANVKISFNKPNGEWTERFQTPYYTGGFLSLSPDGKYLFLENEGIQWVSTSFVEELKPDYLKYAGRI